MSFSVIERNVPVPSSLENGRQYGESGELARKMDIGDSVLCDTLSAAHSLINALRYLKRNGSRRKIGKQYRVWRIR